METQPPLWLDNGEFLQALVSRWLDNGEFLQALVDNDVLNSLASAIRGERQRKFMTAVSSAMNLFQIRISDMLYSFGQCVATQSILHHHNATLEAAD